MNSTLLDQLENLSQISQHDKNLILDTDDDYFIFDKIWNTLSSIILDEILITPIAHHLSDNAINSLKVDLSNRLGQVCSIPIWEYYLSESLCISPIHLFHRPIKNDFLYKKFKMRLLNGELIVFFKKYENLLSKVIILVSHWKNSVITFLHHFNNDLDELKKNFSLGNHPTIDEIKIKSDLHNGGKSVLFLEIKSDQNVNLIYKPKNISTEHIFRKFLNELKKHGLLSVVKEVFYLLHEDYGWVEYVIPDEIKNEHELSDYYTRAGTILCLSYILRITDLHSENIIAQGSNPQIVDMEAMFHPCLLDINNKFSVLETGLIPNDKLECHDLFGFTANNSIQSGTFHCIWTNLGKDDVYPKFINGYYPLQNNIPIFNGKRVMVYDYIESLCNGFKTTYELIMKKKEYFISLIEELARNLVVESRIIMRSTMYYSVILRNLDLYYYNNSDANKNYIVDSLLENIPLYLPCKKQELIDAELSALERQDIPCFRYNSRYNTILENKYIVCNFPNIIDPINSVTIMINELCNTDKEKQLQLIRTSLGKTENLPPPELTII